MTNKPLLSLVSLALLSGSLAIAQQTLPDAGGPPAPPPADGPGGKSSHDPRPKVVRDVRIVRMDGGGDMHPGSRIAPPGMWWKNPDIIQSLSLTADQQKRMDDIFQQSRLQLIDAKANVEKQEVIMEPMLDANPPDTNKVLAQIDHVAQARAELEKANARMLLGIRGVLSADQWTKLQTEERSHHKMMRGPGMPGGPDRMERPERPERPEHSENHGLPELAPLPDLN
jgi:Spy/CpxP family protein refolding chaperone